MQMARWLQVFSVLLLATFTASALECLNGCKNNNGKSSDCENKNGCQQQNCGTCSNVNCGSCTSKSNSCCGNCCGGINNNCECQELDCTKCQGANSCCQKCCKPSAPIVKCCETANQTSIKECCEKNSGSVTTVLQNQCCQQQPPQQVYQPIIPNIILPNITIFINQTPIIVHNNPNINVDHKCGNVSVLTSPSHSVQTGCGGSGPVPVPLPITAPRNQLCCRVRRPPICMPTPTPPLIRCYEQSSPVACGPQCLQSYQQPQPPPPCQPAWPYGQCRTPCTGSCHQGVPQQGCAWPYLDCQQGGNGYEGNPYGGNGYGGNGYGGNGYGVNSYGGNGYVGNGYGGNGYVGNSYGGNSYGGYPGSGYPGGYPTYPVQDNSNGVYDINAIAPQNPTIYMVKPGTNLDLGGGASNPNNIGVKPPVNAPLNTQTKPSNASSEIDSPPSKKNDEKPSPKKKG